MNIYLLQNTRCDLSCPAGNFLLCSIALQQDIIALRPVKSLPKFLSYTTARIVGYSSTQKEITKTLYLRMYYQVKNLFKNIIHKFVPQCIQVILLWRQSQRVDCYCQQKLCCSSCVKVNIKILCQKRSLQVCELVLFATDGQ